MKDQVKCEVCGKMFKRITHKHLKHHNMTLNNYIIEYPNAQIISEATLQKLSTNRVEYWVEKHGEEEGKRKYAEYTNFLATKNTFEYKQKTYGWSRKQFDEFNRSRAQTKENMIKRHGDEIGSQKWLEYCKRQQYAGSSHQYFIDLYGENEGNQRWQQACDGKKHNIKNFVARYGETVGIVKYEEYIASCSRGFSNGEANMVDYILSKLEDIDNLEVYSYKNHQYSIWCEELNSVRSYDLVLLTPKDKVCIEYHGVYWHCHPSIYKPEFIHPHLQISAKEIWDKDKYKQTQIEKLGFTYHVVWEHDWEDQKDLLVASIRQCLI